MMLRQRLAAIKNGWTLQELSGALGDLGTFLPLVLGMVHAVGLDLGTTLIVTGLYNIATGVQFGIPMCVQPMKTLCAVALADAATTLPQVLLAGIFVSGCVLLLGLTGLMTGFSALVPASVVRGIQLGVGLKLAAKGMAMAFQQKGPTGGLEWRPWWGGGEGLLLAVLAFAFVVVTTLPLLTGNDGRATSEQEVEAEGTLARVLVRWAEGRATSTEDVDGAVRLPLTGKGRPHEAGPSVASPPDEHSLLLHPNPHPASPSFSPPSANPPPPPQPGSPTPTPPVPCPAPPTTRSLPTALLLILAGLLLSVVLHPSSLSSLRFGPTVPTPLRPTWGDFWAGTLSMGLPQLPLTTLNSVVATAHLANELFPSHPTSPREVSLSVGILNLLGIWLGAMPACHGSGGLAAQVKFGARTGVAPVMLGGIKLALGLVVGSSLQGLLGGFPRGLLGVMLAFAGVELASVARRQAGGRGYVLMLVTAAGIMGLNSTLWGFVAGLGAHVGIVGYEAVVVVVVRGRRAL